jgi:transposase
MTKAEQTRLIAWRLRLLRQGDACPRTVARTCRYFGVSRKTFYKWKQRRTQHGDAGLADRSHAPRQSPRATRPEVVSKILYLRQRYHFGPGKIADYLRRFPPGHDRWRLSASHPQTAQHEPPAGESEASPARKALAAL